MLSLGTPELSLFLIGPTLGPTELILILVIVVIFFGVGRLPEVFGGLGKGIREFRRAAKDGEEEEGSEQADAAPAEESAEPAVASEANPPEKA
ncbi:MAG: twin-arginine translocase TatA/TatE family subunit [Caldilineaceae bacterium]|nr:twin-arginine translocase TatA/TatE family subunit [Caldilineaceae bacterium]MCY4090663.1 twin-arginine translocase TatA/TatE family subunit [Caldilineaceae bacterium]MCY4117425.1 twin-arginine translocase TatA/TatE family subunit [Caldilineaceae bacterium]MDE0069905.1 twin-arginine translocase TatA/TatE family subunit [Caldilineaceae bacterium]MDE0181598.1 twin-arginine translocase TatA/TatE family subunit [Caldilineaceae bacterium]